MSSPSPRALRRTRRRPPRSTASGPSTILGGISWRDERIEIVDIAFPPDQQLEIVREAAQRPHVKGILAQKPVAFTLEEAVEMVRICDEAGVKLGVNHNMRYDQSEIARQGVRKVGCIWLEGESKELIVAAVKVFAQAADVNRISLLLDQIHQIQDEQERVLASVDVASALIEARFFQEATTLIEALPDQRRRASGFCAIAVKIADEQLDRALRLLQGYYVMPNR
jgi:hypothetical protein